ncbi:RSC complex protein [Collybia nuda]|uniref:RSC complex protein n=1 Tax=Collybia nuda TaxID=64659 RepID=A0A9P5YDM0_9AGAR|nr:RSC complex protein [Collybia nuda]
MTISITQTTAILEILSSIMTATATRGKRQLAGMFLDLVDRTDWPQYYEIIPEPRCLNNIRSGVEKGRYKDATDVYTDISLVFWNALFYNEPTSQIALDATTLKTMLETEWRRKPILPTVRSSPPPSSAQKIHKVVEEPPPASPSPVTEPTPVLPPVVKAPTPAPRVATPVAPSTPLPVTSTSNSSFTYSKPVPIQPRSTQHLSPDMDIDIMSPEPDGQGDEAQGLTIERDAESEEIVRQLEKGLPRWPGFGDQGWTDTITAERIIEILHVIKSYKDVIGNRISAALDAVPEEATVSHIIYTAPLSLKIIENHARAKSYTSSKEFDIDMARLFLKARRWHKPSTEPYGRILLLQRLYQALVSSNPPPGPPYHTTTNFASLRAGPGTTKPVHHGGEGEGVAGVTTHRVLFKDRTFVDEVHYKGWTVKLADWLHLSNPDDPSRPIIGQVFRCWMSDEISKKGQPGLTVSWYYRPEQTFHPAHRTFWEGEVFKTSHFADHPLEDIIEKIACQFTARHIRGRPRPPFWYLGFPLYVCNSRYNDRDRVFVKIKNWNSCVPEEVRKSTEFMPIYPFERTVLPSRFPSPFIGRGSKGAVRGPGGIINAAEGPDDDKGDVSAIGKKRTRRNPGGDAEPNKTLHNGIAHGTNAAAASSQYYYQASHLSQQVQLPQNQRASGPDRSIITAAGGSAFLGHSATVEKLPAETAKHFDRDPETNEVLWFSAAPVDTARAPKPRYSLAYLHFLAMQRKEDSTVSEPDGMDVEDERTSTKRLRFQATPTVTETLRAALAQ